MFYPGFFTGWNPGGTPCPSYFGGSGILPTPQSTPPGISYFTGWNPGGTPCPSYFAGSGSSLISQSTPPGIGYFTGWNPGGTPCPSYFAGSGQPAPFEVDLLAYLNSKAWLTFYPGHLPQEAPLPACSFFLVSEEPKYTLGSAAGLTARVYQFDQWSNYYMDTIMFERRLRRVLHGYRGWMGGSFVSSCRIQDVMDLPYEPNVDDSDQGTYHRVAEYRILLRETIPSF
jgi:hypothetical protein